MHDITRFGAIGDGVTDCTHAIQAALRRASAANPVVHVPAGGVFLTRPVLLPSGVTLQVDGTLRGATGGLALSLWPTLPPLPTYGRDRDGAKPRRYRALLLALDAHDVVLRGGGVIDGAGPWWWERRRTLRFGRPHLVEFYNSSHVEVHGVTLRDSPFWTLHPVYCTHVHVHHIAIRAPLYAPNTDGIDPDSSRHVLIEHNDVSCGDDHVAIKSGMNGLARAAFPRLAAENVTVRHNVFRAGMGVSVGSETSGGVRDVHVHHNLILGHGWSVALHVKSAPQRGTLVERVSFRHNVVRNTSAFMRLATFGSGAAPTAYEPTRVRELEWRNNTYEGPSDRRVRSKFICPSVEGRCRGIRVVDNRVVASKGKWQCVQIATFEASGNQPAGLPECMRRSGGGGGGGGSAGRATKRRARGRKKKRSHAPRRRKVRKFDWRTQSDALVDEAAA